jgi:acetyltransferase-like isoleucine patch superfamily enzyme
MRFAGRGPVGRFATRMAVCGVSAYKSRRRLARYNRAGYIASSATISHSDLRLGSNVFIGDRLVIHQERTGGPLELGDRVHLYDDTIVEIGPGGSVRIGADTHIQPKCQITSYEAGIEIGTGVQIAPFCAFYSYDHGFAPGQPIRGQTLATKGPIVIEDDAWLGAGVIVLSGVRIGRGAVVGAGAVVTKDIPAGAIALGQPARVVRMR